MALAGASKPLAAACVLQEHALLTLRMGCSFSRAQEMPPMVLKELRLLSSDAFNSRNLLGIVLSGDLRLNN